MVGLGLVSGWFKMVYGAVLPSYHESTTGFFYGLCPKLNLHPPFCSGVPPNQCSWPSPKISALSNFPSKPTKPLCPPPGSLDKASQPHIHLRVHPGAPPPPQTSRGCPADRSPAGARIQPKAQGRRQVRGVLHQAPEDLHRQLPALLAPVLATRGGVPWSGFAQQGSQRGCLSWRGIAQKKNS